MGAAQATPGVLAAAPTLLAGMLSVASVLSVATDAIQMSTPVLPTNEVTRPRMPVRSEVCWAMRKTDTTTPMSVPRLLNGASRSMRSATPASPDQAPASGARLLRATRTRRTSRWATKAAATSPSTPVSSKAKSPGTAKSGDPKSDWRVPVDAPAKKKTSLSACPQPPWKMPNTPTKGTAVTMASAASVSLPGRWRKRAVSAATSERAISAGATTWSRPGSS